MNARSKQKLKELHDSLDLLFDQIGKLQQKLLASAADETDWSEAAVEDPGLKQQLAQVQSELSAELLTSGTAQFTLAAPRTSDNSHRPAKRLEHNVRASAIRSLHQNGKSVRVIAKELGMSRNTVAKYIKNPDAPRYHLKQPRQRPHSDPWRSTVEQMVQVESSKLSGRRPSARQIHRRLCKEHNYSGSESTLRKLLADIRKDPGQAEARRNDCEQVLCRNILSMSNALAPPSVTASLSW